MNKTRIFILLALLVCASLWFVPAAWASQCGYVKPNKYLPALTLINAPKNVDFELRQGSFTTEIRNTSSDPVYLLSSRYSSDTSPVPPEVTQEIPSGMTPNIKIVDGSFYYWQADKTWYLAEKEDFVSIYLINDRITIFQNIKYASCDKDGGIANRHSIPPPQSIFLKILYKEEIIDITVVFEYKADPNYDLRVEDYDRHTGRKVYTTLLIIFIVTIIVILFVFVMIIKAIGSAINRRYLK